LLRQQENSFHIETKDLVERLRGILGLRSAPVRPRIVHENVQLGFALAHLLCQSRDLLFPGEVGWKGDARTAFRKLRRDLFTNLLLAGRNVNLRSISRETLNMPGVRNALHQQSMRSKRILRFGWRL